jgi:phosphohistidine phosphatase
MAERVLDTPTFFVSSARRARDTFSGLSDGGADVLAAPLAGSVSEQSTLYTFSWRTLSDWLSQCDDALDNLALIGHNPAMTEFINYLCPSLALDNLPTAGWVWLRFDNTSWSAAVATAGQANVMTSLRPKEVMGASL